VTYEDGSEVLSLDFKNQQVFWLDIRNNKTNRQWLNKKVSKEFQTLSTTKAIQHLF